MGDKGRGGETESGEEIAAILLLVEGEVCSACCRISEEWFF